MGVEVGVGVGVGANSGVGVSVGAGVGVGVGVAGSAVGTPVEIVGISVGSAVDVDGSSPGATVDVEGSAVGTAVGVNGTSAEFSFDSSLSASGGSTNVIADSGVAGGIVSQASVPFSFGDNTGSKQQHAGSHAENPVKPELWLNAVSLTATLSDYIGRRFIHGFNRFFVFHISTPFDSKIIRNPPVAFTVDSNVTLKILKSGAKMPHICRQNFLCH